MLRQGLLAALAVAVVALPVAAQAQDEPQTDGQTGAQTEAAELYDRHCAVCHGADAQGGGPLAPALILQPPDLTRLSERNGGVFPVIRVVMRIDGRDPLVAHGSPMPVYGGFFEGDGQASIKAETGQPIVAAEQVVALTDYLRELQR